MRSIRLFSPLAALLVFAQLGSAQTRPTVGPKHFAGPSTAVPAPLGTKVPVIFWDRNRQRDYGYGYGYSGLGVGVSFGVGGLYDPLAVDPSTGIGVGVGFWGNNYNGFYSNGFSMYGPPVPTYAPIPGMFGGADQRFLGNNPGPLFSTPYTSGDWKSSKPITTSPITPLPDPTQQLVPTVPLQQMPATPITDFPKEIPPIPAVASLTMNIVVPENAQIYFDDALTKQTGKVRSFVSPEQKLGEVLEYNVRVEWTEAGVPLSKRRKIAGKAGEQITVDFTKD
ncbi:TIGR03000 domain-containing protein [Telmatocola sphagniphila]|uniref:TIGR03000 domain-containing protein n=1 Tax=Telmatocola sphagniphila TaxID=1123043 RepID=A0A8E6ETG9_9BACT|nr:TIGR03000 domain-containing protein [Telmatocola sphagniphila]QVL32419.1 TIGR03000 domain-containing protein [Telmatocola sphagniphila]